MLRLAYHNLFQNRVRLAMSTGGVALALVLILALDALFVGMERDITAYIDNSEADIFVSQPGVRNMHMASSWIPEDTVDKVANVPGVSEVTPILYLENVMTAGDEPYPVYVIGLPEQAQKGLPWEIREGERLPGPGEAVIDAGIADTAGVHLGDSISILGFQFMVGGLAEGTANLVNSVAFVSASDFLEISGTEEAVSFVLATVDSGESAASVASRIETDLGDVTAQTQDEFSKQERQVVRDMATDIVAIMNVSGLMIGLAVMGLTVYTATLARRAEYGVLKALGANSRQLYGVVLAQAIYSVALAFVVAIGITLLLSMTIPQFIPSLSLYLSPTSALKVSSLAVVIAGFSAVIPIMQIAGLDPALVFRGRGR
jgi:putative ABC transport system permease protein